MIRQELIQILRKIPPNLIITINVILVTCNLCQKGSNAYAFQYFSTSMATLMLIIHFQSCVMQVSYKVHARVHTPICTWNFFHLKF